MPLNPKQVRLLGWLSAILIAGFLSISVMSFLVSRSSIREGISEQTLPLTADNVYSEIQKDLLRPVFIASLMAHDTFLRDWILGGERDVGRIGRFLNEVKSKYGTVISFLATEKSRRYYYQGGLLRAIEGPDGPTDKWFYRVRAMAAPYETNVDPGEIDQQSMTVYINYRVLDYQGNFIGATGVGLTLDSVSLLIDKYQRQFKHRIFFVDRQGNVVLAGQEPGSLRGNIRQVPGLAGLADRILGDDAPASRLEYRRDGSLVLVNARYIPELGWHLVVEQDEEREVGAVTGMLRVNLAIGLVVSLVVLAVMRLAIVRYQARIEAMGRTALAQAARETELAAEQQRFVAMVSHEFRTPLSIIDAALQSVRRHEAGMDPALASRLQMIRRAELRLQELVDNYLTKDRLDQVDRPRMAEALDLFALVARTARRAERDNLVLDLAEPSPTVHGDPELLRIAFANLISNASKYSPAGAPIRISAEVEGGFGVVRVADQGCGIAAAELAHVFEPYYRGGGGGRASGSGLGLYLVKRIIEDHGGQVAVEESGEAGTTMSVRLPIAAPDSADAPA